MKIGIRISGTFGDSATIRLLLFSALVLCHPKRFSEAPRFDVSCLLWMHCKVLQSSSVFLEPVICCESVVIKDRCTMPDGMFFFDAVAVLDMSLFPVSESI